MWFLFSIFLFNSPPLQTDLETFKHFKKDGSDAYCLVNYEHKEIHCNYKTIDACREEYVNTRGASVCFSRKSLKLGDEQ